MMWWLDTAREFIFRVLPLTGLYAWTLAKTLFPVMLNLGHS